MNRSTRLQADRNTQDSGDKNMCPKTYKWRLFFYSWLLWWSSLLLYWGIQGTFFTAIFVLGHDCGHGSFSHHAWLNDLVGTVLHGLILAPYYMWKLTHRLHHRNTANLQKDEVCFSVCVCVCVCVYVCVYGVLPVYKATIGRFEFRCGVSYQDQ